MTERLLYAAIDLLGNRLMRALGAGDAASEGAGSPASDDPIAAALRWRDQGARWLHLVDLDGAREGAPRQLETIHAIIQASGMPSQVAGGLRDTASVEAALGAGAERVVLSAATPDDQALVAECVARWGKRIVVALEARDGLATVAGWLPSDAATALDIARAMGYLGVETLLFTSVTTSGADDPLPSELRRALPDMRLIAGGAIASLDDLRRLFALGMDGVLLGRALYAGLFTLEEALAAASAVGEAQRISDASQEEPERDAEPAVSALLADIGDAATQEMATIGKPPSLYQLPEEPRSRDMAPGDDASLEAPEVAASPQASLPARDIEALERAETQEIPSIGKAPALEQPAEESPGDGMASGKTLSSE